MMSLCHALLSFTSALLLSLAPSASAINMQAEGPDMSGEWILNEELSEDPREKMRKRMRSRSGVGSRPRGGGFGVGGGAGVGGRGAGGRGGGLGGPGSQGGTPGGGVGAQRPQTPRIGGGPSGGAGGPGGAMVGNSRGGFDRLIIDHDEPTVTITDSEGRARTMRTDWSNWQPSERGEIKTEWKRQKLVVEQRNAEGRKTTSKYHINPEGQLVISTTLNPRSGNRGRSGPVTFDRIYDRAAADPLSLEANSDRD